MLNCLYKKSILVLFTLVVHFFFTHNTAFFKVKCAQCQWVPIQSVFSLIFQATHTDTNFSNGNSCIQQVKPFLMIIIIWPHIHILEFPC